MARYIESHGYFVLGHLHSVEIQNATLLKELMSALSNLSPYLIGNGIQATSGRPSYNKLQ